jgi:hypothetical protein
LKVYNEGVLEEKEENRRLLNKEQDGKEDNAKKLTESNEGDFPFSQTNDWDPREDKEVDRDRQHLGSPSADGNSETEKKTKKQRGGWHQKYRAKKNDKSGLTRRSVVIPDGLDRGR